MRDGGIVDVTSVHGEVGTSTDIFVLMPAHKSAAVLHVNGRPASFSRTPAGLRTTVTFAGTEFHHAQQVGPVNSSFVGGRFSATLTVPSWVFEQLRERARRISIPWTDEDLRTTWLAPARLLLYVPIAEPDDYRLDGRLAIDVHGIALPRAYTAIRPDK